MGYPAWMILLQQALEVIARAGAVLQAIGDFEQIRDIRNKSQTLVDSALTLRGLTTGLVQGPSGGPGASPSETAAVQAFMPGLDPDVPPPEEES